MGSGYSGGRNVDAAHSAVLYVAVQYLVGIAQQLPAIQLGATDSRPDKFYGPRACAVAHGGPAVAGRYQGCVMGIIIWLIVGAIAGWLAGMVVKGGGFGLIGDIIVGIVGSVIAGWLLPQIGFPLVGGSFVGAIIDAFIGAVILLLILRLIKRA
jgi:uncharacterized membrane protein YeaQ/YmgE (transglycosylase-associated protein family)